MSSLLGTILADLGFGTATTVIADSAAILTDINAVEVGAKSIIALAKNGATVVEGIISTGETLYETVVNEAKAISPNAEEELKTFYNGTFNQLKTWLSSREVLDTKATASEQAPTDADTLTAGGLSHIHIS